MKSKLLLLGVLLTGVLFMTSCEEDDLEDKLAEEEFEGDVRDRFVGTWTVTESSKLQGARNYQVTMEKDSSYPARVNMYNLYLFGTTSDSVIVNISSVLINAMTIPNQTVADNFVDGNGELIDDNNIDLVYRVDDGNGEIDTVSARLVR